MDPSQRGSGEAKGKDKRKKHYVVKSVSPRDDLECVVGTVTKGFKGDSPVSISEGWVNGCWHPLH